MNEDDRDTPVEIWRMRSELPRIGLPGEIPPVDVMAELLTTVQELLSECRDIKISAQRASDLALAGYEKLPKLEKRMARVELIAFGAVIANMLMTLALCHR